MKTKSLMQIIITTPDLIYLKAMVETIKKGDRISVITVIISSDDHTIMFIGGNPEHPHTTLYHFDKEVTPLQSGMYSFDAQTFKEIVLDCAESHFNPLQIDLCSTNSSFPYRICASKRSGAKRFLHLSSAEPSHIDYLEALFNKKMPRLSLSQTTEIRRVITNNPFAEFIQIEKNTNKTSVQKSGIIYSLDKLNCEAILFDLTLNKESIESFKRLSCPTNNEIIPLSIDITHDNIIMSSSNGNSQSCSLADLSQFNQNKEENGTVVQQIDNIDKDALLKEIQSYKGNNTMKKENLSHLFLSHHGVFLICKTLKAGGICQLKSEASQSKKETLYNINLAELIHLHLTKSLPKDHTISLKILRLNDKTLWLALYKFKDDKNHLVKIQIEANYDENLKAEFGFMADNYPSDNEYSEPEQLDMLGFDF